MSIFKRTKKDTAEFMELPGRTTRINLITAERGARQWITTLSLDEIEDLILDAEKMKHKVTTVVRGTSDDQGLRKGYAASCTCGAITFGGFVTRTAAKDSLEHLEEVPVPDAEITYYGVNIDGTLTAEPIDIEEARK